MGTGQVNDGTRWNSTFVADPWGHAMESSTQGPNTQKPAESLELNGAQRAELKSSAGRIWRSHLDRENDEKYRSLCWCTRVVFSFSSEGLKGPQSGQQQHAV